METADESPETRNIDAQSRHGDAAHRDLARSLNADQRAWLAACPVILNVGAVGSTDYVVVHGGLAPGVPLEKQDPWLVMNMRSIDPGTFVPSATRKGVPWEKIWNRAQRHMGKHFRHKTVVYGHDSRRGLNLQKWSKGMDSNCVRGGRLTGLVVDSRGREKTVSVKCKRWDTKGVE